MSAKRPKRESVTATRTTLLRRVRDLNDEDGWREFDSLYRPLLVGYARSRGLREEAAEEIAQECLTAVASIIEMFEPRCSFRNWLRGMVNHKVSDHLAPARRMRQVDTDVLENAPDPAESPGDHWERQWDDAHLRHMLAHLRTDFARHTLQAFQLYVLEERPVDQISGLLCMTPNQIYVAKARVIRWLKEHFDE